MILPKERSLLKERSHWGSCQQAGETAWACAMGEQARACVCTRVCVCVCVCARAWVPVPFFKLPPKTFLLKMVIFKPGCAEFPGELYKPPMTGTHRKQLEGGHPGCGVQTSAQFSARRFPLCSRELAGLRTWTWKELRGPAGTRGDCGSGGGKAREGSGLPQPRGMLPRPHRDFKELIVFQKQGQARQSRDSCSGE